MFLQFVDQPVMVLLSPSPNSRRRKMQRKAAESTLLGGCSGVPHLLPKNVQVMHFCVISSTDLKNI